jgi:hypothetical protein
VLDGKKVFHDVAEALDADAQAVERDLGAVAHGAVVQFAGCGPTLQSEVFEERAAHPDARGARGKRLAPRSPLFAVELFESGLRFVLLLLFATLEDLEQGLGGGIIRTSLWVGWVRNEFTNLL